MGSRSFSDERPQRPHLVRRFKRGLAGEVADLRADVEKAFGGVESEIDSLIIGGAAGSLHVEFTSFDWITGGHLDLGIIGQARTIARVSLEIVNAFNEDVAFKVGDEASNDRFLAIEDVNAQEQGRFHTFNDHYYSSDTLTRLYFIGSTPPTTGYAKLVMYIS